jgi:homoserine dehydrogenase
MTSAIIPRTNAPEFLDAPAIPQPKLRTLRVALAGCGTVGSALVRLIESSTDTIAARHGLNIELSRVLVRDTTRDRQLPLARQIFTNDWSSFIEHDVDVVIEAIGGTDTAADIARGALARSRKFVTANKELIAAHGRELATLANTFDASLDFGASVGGSAPVISLLRDLLGTTSPASVRGIINGTCNYILSQIERGRTFADALDNAQRKGLAEPDPSRDLDGRDAASKLAVIAWTSFGIAPNELNVSRIGLDRGIERIVRHATAIGARVRFIAECRALAGGEVVASVEPVIVPRESAFGRTDLEDNRVEVDLGWASPLCVSGPGEGGDPTAVALLADLLASSSPRNERGTCASLYTPAEDSRTHQWLIVSSAKLRQLADRLDRFGIQIGQTIDTPSGNCAIVIARRAEITDAIAQLKAGNIDASIARLELATKEERFDA